jgi:hypothetical protein
MAWLALAQGLLGLLRAVQWLRTGVDLFEPGRLILVMVGAAALFRGAFIAMIALLYGLFFCGALLGTGWARWVGLTAGAINILLVVNAVAQEAPPLRAFLWAVIPMLLTGYLLSPGGREALKARAVPAK